MGVTLPLNQMSTEDKLRTMEEIWTDLTQNASTVPSPAWHEDILHEREARVEQGQANFTDWPSARERIRNRTR